MQVRRLIAAGLTVPLAAVVGSSTFDTGEPTPLPSAAALPPTSAPVAAAQPTPFGNNVRNAPAALRSATPTRDVPPAALAAYQRASAVINTSAPGCGLPWQLLAAIGQVETDHGRRLPAKSAPLPDTDAGQYDGDATADHPVGPFQILPSTWASVAVDADGDGTRNPESLDDAALGLAVRLCVDDANLSTPAGQRAAVAHHNADGAYLTLVIDLAAAYTTATTALSAFATPTEMLAPTAIKVAAKPSKLRAEGGAAMSGRNPGSGGTAPGAEPQPTQPTRPEPTDPVTPTEPGTPTEPTTPTTPTEPGTPTTPTEPTEPGTPTEELPDCPVPGEPEPPTEPTSDPSLPADEPGDCIPAEPTDDTTTVPATPVTSTEP